MVPRSDIDDRGGQRGRDNLVFRFRDVLCVCGRRNENDAGETIDHHNNGALNNDAEQHNIAVQHNDDTKEAYDNPNEHEDQVMNDEEDEVDIKDEDEGENDDAVDEANNDDEEEDEETKTTTVAIYTLVEVTIIIWHHRE